MKLEIKMKNTKNPESTFSWLNKLSNFNKEVKLNEDTPFLFIFIYLYIIVYDIYYVSFEII
jgi:hypothetical protein